MQKTRLEICGFCQSSRDLAHYDDPSIAVWGLNRGYLFMPRADAWFEMHGPHIYGWEQRRPGDHLAWLKAFPGPVYMHRADPSIPNSVTYPLEAVAADIGPYVWRVGEKTPLHDTTTEPYLSSSIAMELALAIHLRQFEEIALYGIDLNTESEYIWQKPGVEFLCGVAVGRGIRIIVPDNCALLAGNIYGRGYLSPEGERMSYEQLESRVKGLQQQEKEVALELAQTMGALKELDFMQSQMVPGIDHERVEERKKRFAERIGALRGKQQQLVGAIKETAYWIHITPDGQKPAEAIAQLTDGLRQSGIHLLDGHESEGPVSELGAMMHVEHGTNGHDPEAARKLLAGVA